MQGGGWSPPDPDREPQNALIQMHDIEERQRFRSANRMNAHRPGERAGDEKRRHVVHANEAVPLRAVSGNYRKALLLDTLPDLRKVPVGESERPQDRGALGV